MDTAVGSCRYSYIQLCVDPLVVSLLLSSAFLCSLSVLIFSPWRKLACFQHCVGIELYGSYRSIQFMDMFKDNSEEIGSVIFDFSSGFPLFESSIADFFDQRVRT